MKEETPVEEYCRLAVAYYTPVASAPHFISHTGKVLHNSMCSCNLEETERDWKMPTLKRMEELKKELDGEPT